MDVYRDMKREGEVDWEALEADLRDDHNILWNSVKVACEIPDDEARRIDGLFEWAIESAKKKDDWHFWDALIDIEKSLSLLDVHVAKKCQRERG